MFLTTEASPSMTTNLDANADDNDDNDHVDNESLTFGFVVINHVCRSGVSLVLDALFRRFKLASTFHFLWCAVACPRLHDLFFGCAVFMRSEQIGAYIWCGVVMHQFRLQPDLLSNFDLMAALLTR